MTVDRARAVADAVLFEGYLLYPYRASALKNRMRWQFGVLAPGGADLSEPRYSRTECLVDCHAGTTVDVLVRFLRLRRRDGDEASDEGVTCEVGVTVPLDGSQHEHAFGMPGGEETDGQHCYRTWPLSGEIRVDSDAVEETSTLRKLRVTVENGTVWTPDPQERQREHMLRRSLVSAHSLLAVHGGEFVSLLEPEAGTEQAAKSCRNENTWPVLVGEHGTRDVMLSSPIILYDYPAVAEQSPGDLFDAAEIDEILTLRTLTLTEEEKREARATDPRAAAIIDRTENMPAEVLERMHGTARVLPGEPE